MDFDPRRTRVFTSEPLTGRQIAAVNKDDDDDVNLDGISDRGKYQGITDNFTLKDKFSSFNHLVPG